MERRRASDFFSRRALSLFLPLTAGALRYVIYLILSYIILSYLYLILSYLYLILSYLVSYLILSIYLSYLPQGCG